VVFRRTTTALILCALSGSATADDQPSVATDRPAYVMDGEAMVFIWLPLAGAMYFDRLAPRSTPLGFDSSEGGKTSHREYEVPQLAITGGGLAIMGAMALGDDPSRGYHVKGMAESMATSGFVTTSAKVAFGRHRPDYDPMTSTNPDDRKSFPSGHATRTFSVLTYTALYLRHHGFDQWRKPGTLPAWEVATYAGLGTLAIGLAGERVVRNRHNLTDVIAGAGLGTASSVAFFYWQEHQYKKRAHKKRRVSSEIVSPNTVLDPSAPGVALPAVDGPMLSFGGTY
jgi:hypothetical protein